MSKPSKNKQLELDEAEVKGNEEETNATATLLPRKPHRGRSLTETDLEERAAERNIKGDGCKAERGIDVTDHGGGRANRKKWKRIQFRKKVSSSSKATPEQERNLGGEMARLNGRDEANGEVSL